MKSSKARAIVALVEAICEAVEANGDFVPEGDMYVMLQSVMPDMSTDVFNRLVEFAIVSGRVKRGDMPHTLVPTSDIDRFVQEALNVQRLIG